MRKTIMLALVLLTLVAIPRAALQETTARKLTVMIYLCGSNLESNYGSASADLEEIAKAELDYSQVSVLVMGGGSSAWASVFRAEETTIKELGRPPFGATSGYRTIQTSMGRKNMGDPATLSQFLAACVEHAPAEEYALIIWDHGGGPVNGVCWDEQNDGDHLTLDELTAALSASPFGERKLSWIGFDACLMSSVEVASKMAPYAEYMIASQAEEPASGWNYAFLKGLEYDQNGAETGKRVVDAYFSVPQKTAADLTMACIDLSKVAAVEAGMDAMYQGMTAYLSTDTFSAIAKLRQNATGFGKSAEDIVSSSGYDLVDVVSLSDCYASENPEGAKRIEEAVNAAVVYSKSNLDGCNGLSVYHPFRNQKRFLSEWSKTYKNLDFCPGYASYVDSYGKIMAGEHLVRWNDLMDIQAENDGSLITLNITEEQAANLASARLVVLARNPYDSFDNAFFRLYSTTDVEINGTMLSASYDGTVMYLVTDTGVDTISKAISYRVTENGIYQLAFYPFDENNVRFEEPIIAEYVMDTSGQLLLKGYLVYDEMTDTYTSRAGEDLSQYKGVTIRNEYRVPTCNALGEYDSFDRWELDVHTGLQWKARSDIPHVHFHPTLSVDTEATEDRWVVFEITDTQGNVYTTELAPIGGSKFFKFSGDTFSDDMPHLSSADILYAPEYHLYNIILNVMNLSSEEQFYYFDQIRINGISFENEIGILTNGNGEKECFGAKCLLPGEMGKIYCYLEESVLEALIPDKTIEQISGELTVMSGETGDIISWYRFSFVPTASETEISYNDGLTVWSTYDIPVDYPLWEDEYLMIGINNAAIVQYGQLAKYSRILKNIYLENTANYDISCTLTDVRLNGVPIEKKIYGTDCLGNNPIKPGENVYLNIDLRYSDICAILPDASLVTIEANLNIYNTCENTRPIKIPFAFQGEIPLDCFYPETSVMPTKELIDLGREQRAADADPEKLLFAYGDCAVYLQELYLLKCHPVALFRVENASESEWDITLSEARLNGQEAVIGNTVTPIVLVRNRRNQVYHIDKEPWQETSCVNLKLQPGETQYCYAEITVKGVKLTEFNSTSFRAYMHQRHGKATVYFDDAEFSVEEPYQMSDDYWTVFYDYESFIHVKQGQPLPTESDVQVLSPSVHTPAANEVQEIHLKTSLPEDEQIVDCYYFLRRLVHSDAELAEMNITNNLTEEKQAFVSFANGREWMIYEALGSMTIEEDGCSAFAVYPGLRPMISNGKESIPMMVCGISTNENGSFIIKTLSDYALLLCSYRFYAELAGGIMKDIEIVWNPQDNQAQATSAPFVSAGYPSLSDYVGQQIILHPAELSMDQLSETIMDGNLWKKNQLYQYQVLDKPQIQLSLEPLCDPENYDVLFFGQTADGVIQCFDARPLTDFIESSETVP